MSILRVDAGSDSEDEHKMREGHFIKVNENFSKGQTPLKMFLSPKNEISDVKNTYSDFGNGQKFAGLEV